MTPPVAAAEPSQAEIDRLAALIREVDGPHSLGAGALAEALVARGVGVEARIRAELADEIRAIVADVDLAHAERMSAILEALHATEGGS